MNQRKFTSEEYIERIEKGLQDFSDRDIIIQELKDYIWDLATDIATSSNLPQSECFRLAIDRLEDPEKLIAEFKLENSPDSTEEQVKRANEKSLYLVSKKQTSFKQKCIFSLISIVFAYLLMLMTGLSSILPGNRVINIIKVIFFTFMIGSLSYFFDKSALFQQSQKLRNIFSKERSILKIKIGSVSLPLIDTRIIQRIRVIFASLLTLVSIFLIVFNNTIGLSNIYPHFIENNVAIATIAFIILSLSTLISNIIQLWIIPKQILKTVLIINYLIVFTTIAIILMYFPIDSDYSTNYDLWLSVIIMGSIIRNLCIIYLLFILIKLFYQFFSAVISKRNFHQENKGREL